MNILIIQNRPGIGDQCLYLKYLHEISQSFNSKITLLTKERSCAKDFLSNDVHLKQIKYFEELGQSNLQLFKWVRENKFNKIFIFHYGIKYPLICKIAGSKQVRFYGVLKKKSDIVKDGYNFTLRCLNKKTIENRFKLVSKVSSEKKNDLVIGIGGSGYQKKWSISKYIRLISELNKKYDFRLILAGGPDDKIDATEIEKGLNIKNVISLCDLKLTSCLDYIQDGKLYIGNDTSFMHLAAGYGLKSYGIFGDTPNLYASYTENIHAIIPEGYRFVTHQSKAMDKITVEHVFNSVEKDFKDLFNLKTQ